MLNWLLQAGKALVYALVGLLVLAVIVAAGALAVVLAFAFKLAAIGVLVVFGAIVMVGSLFYKDR